LKTGGYAKREFHEQRRLTRKGGSGGLSHGKKRDAAHLKGNKRGDGIGEPKIHLILERSVALSKRETAKGGGTIFPGRDRCEKPIMFLSLGSKGTRGGKKSTQAPKRRRKIYENMSGRPLKEKRRGNGGRVKV